MIRWVLIPFLFVMLAAYATPFDEHVEKNLTLLASPTPAGRAGAAENLGYLRAYDAAPDLCEALTGEDATVRREAALALAWCGGRDDLDALADALSDSDWLVRQSAWVSLTNLTGMEFPFDAQAPDEKRTAQAEIWRAWIDAMPADGIPDEVLELLPDVSATTNLARGKPVDLSSAYKGAGKDLTDGQQSGSFWQTKEAPFPQSCTLDFGAPTAVGHVVVHQYGDGFCMTDYALQASDDGKSFTEILRKREKSPPLLALSFKPVTTRYLRIVSYNTQNRTYPTTFYEIEAFKAAPPAVRLLDRERGLRALGALGGDGAAQLVAEQIAPCASRDIGTPDGRHMVQAGIRSLGRLADADTLPLLMEFLQHPHWARYAADALGDFGGTEATKALIDAYPRYALNLKYEPAKHIPVDDRPGLSPVDRMYETPNQIASALARLPLKRRTERSALRKIAPLLVVNLPGDFDGAYLYSPEAHQENTRYLLDRAGVRADIADLLFAVLTQADLPETHLAEVLAQPANRWIADVPHAAAWLPTLCDKGDTDRLIALLDHDNGWVRMNAAKTLMFLDTREAIPHLLAALESSKPESDYGFYGEFRFYQVQEDGSDIDAHDEYNDPSPRWREAYIRALGLFGATEATPLLETLMNDERNVLDTQYAAAMALQDLDTPDARQALAAVESTHPYHSIRTVAREALYKRKELEAKEITQTGKQKTKRQNTHEFATGMPNSIIFIQGPNKMPNDFQIDPWRQTYSTTDTGPTYRIGHNVYRMDMATLSPTPLTTFEDGFVADCEVSWDGQRIVFCHRGGDTDPWWHIYEVNADGSGLRQLTAGPYHDVQPAYLPDGRIVFSTSRMGMRDEYHGYLSTGLAVMNADGSDLHNIGFNLGRDNEPAILDDGRIVFSRLELFYSRLKTELPLHAVYPDGTHNVTLYGPEFRAFWRQVTIDSKEDWWGEVPGRHRVLRLTQPQPFGNGRIVCATTAGITIVGPGRMQHRIVPHDKTMAVTTPFPLDDSTLLCAATKKLFEENGKAKRVPNDTALYTLDVESGALTLLYDKPGTAEFEARPLRARKQPPVLVEHPHARSNRYTMTMNCRSAFITRDARVAERGKLLRVIEGMPITGRHRTHIAMGENAWRNHTGTLARVLGTIPLSADGSFNIEVPADRLVHLQVLDSDRRTVGNQLIWMYGRPGEVKSCVGCHETPDTTTEIQKPGFAQAAQASPVPCLPHGDEFTYRAKFWNKGELPDEGEERTRTVRAVNLPARY